MRTLDSEMIEKLNILFNIKVNMEKDAFIITDGKSYILNLGIGGYARTLNINNSTRYANYEDASEELGVLKREHNITGSDVKIIPVEVFYYESGKVKEIKQSKITQS